MGCLCKIETSSLSQCGNPSVCEVWWAYSFFIQESRITLERRSTHPSPLIFSSSCLCKNIYGRETVDMEIKGWGFLDFSLCIFEFVTGPERTLMVQTSIQYVCFFLASRFHKIYLGWFDQTNNRYELDPVFTDLIIWLHLYWKRKSVSMHYELLHQNKTVSLHKFIYS